MGLSAKAVVVIGGGLDSELMLRELKRYTPRLTVLLSTLDRSRYSPELPDDGEIHAPDGARASLLALGADPETTQIMERLFAYRFTAGGEATGPVFGTMLLSALTDITGSAEQACEAAAQVLKIRGRVLPLAAQSVPLLAERLDGAKVSVRTPSELIAAAEGSGLQAVQLAQPLEALGAALEAIAAADIIVLGPADFYFDIVAPLELTGLRAALAASAAIKIFICNILTQPWTTEGWPASRFIRSVRDALGPAGALDYAIVSSMPLAAELLASLPAEIAHPVQLDLEHCLALGLNVIARPVTAETGLHYDGEKLARTILFLGGERLRGRGVSQETGLTSQRTAVLAPRAYST